MFLVVPIPKWPENECAIAILWSERYGQDDYCSINNINGSQPHEHAIMKKNILIGFHLLKILC